jgi:hypothetical protein
LGITVYPNPTTGISTVSVSGLNAGNMTISVYDMQGQIIMQKEELISSSDYSTPIDLSNVAKGVYTVKINTGNDFGVKELVVR